MSGRTIILVSTLALAIGSQAFAAESLSLDSLPPAVQAAVKKVAGDAPVKKIGKEEEDGKVIYEAQFDVNGVKHTASISENGDLQEEEIAMKVADLPAAVSEAVKKAEPQAKIKEAASVKAGEKYFYEVGATVDEANHEIQIASDGTLIANKVEKEEAEAPKEKK